MYPETVPPGESVSIPIILSLSRPGRIDIRGLLVAADDTTPEELAITTVALSVDCQPLLSIITATQNSRRRLGEYLLDVEISNHANKSIKLDSMAVVSPFWGTTMPNL